MSENEVVSPPGGAPVSVCHENNISENKQQLKNNKTEDNHKWWESDNTDDDEEEEEDYVQQCQDYLGSDLKQYMDDWDSNDYDTGISEDNKIIRAAHKKKNEELLKDVRFNGCGLNRGCEWIYNHKRCTCGEYKGFCWNTDDVDWWRDISIKSEHWVGYKEKMWEIY